MHSIKKLVSLHYRYFIYSLKSHYIMFRKFIFDLLLCSLGLMILYCCFHKFVDISIFSLNICYSYIFFLLCLLCCSKSYYIMTPRLLGSYSSNCLLDYKVEHDNRNSVGKIYVRLSYDFFWHELYYDLCIPKNCTHKCYDDYVSSHRLCKDLLASMEHKLGRDKMLSYSYGTFHTNRILYSILSLILYLLCLLFIWGSY